MMGYTEQKKEDLNWRQTFQNTLKNKKERGRKEGKRKGRGREGKERRNGTIKNHEDRI